MAIYITIYSTKNLKTWKIWKLVLNMPFIRMLCNCTIILLWSFSKSTILKTISKITQWKMHVYISTLDSTKFRTLRLSNEGSDKNIEQADRSLSFFLNCVVYFEPPCIYHWLYENLFTNRGIWPPARNPRNMLAGAGTR